ncbi:hypothetical protein L226DRAFT_547365 [Lentinus tigrinus ALCF2SS1-7]|uniref:CCHC-type domain-containing protein n=1 Tax=Lentinus tigrinus ALCF2SS1-6 TaxID=1328759 RepID=A0A5C2RZ46_9APHY|nr:hypothetical protein L227DRAFT_588054 [Lentinus tigrinus ALCF2SS1-6]RPD71522.1 hypothetical protein L226DRAFT_547365 [Lentinus tigrinus ALCF2SS1-7]
MATRGLGRIARLTLFSGPNCSLCDTAKAELAKVRQNRAFDLNIINIQDKGQERWKKKYVYWIPALHIEGKEVAKGRWDAQTVDQAPDEDSLDVRRCFNCGSPEHTMSDCPDPLDRALVSLSRQLFNFFRGEWSGPFHRLHEVEEWRRQRLRWLDEFEPGQVKGPLLREALGLSEGDIGERVEWLPRIACWGYPPGWVGVRDPRERVWERAAGVDDSPDEDLEFVIHTDDGPELCLLPGISDADTDATTSSEEGEIKSDSATFPGRWATYPATYFLSSRLPIYKGYSLPAITRDDPPPGPRPQPTSTPPWRLPGAFGPEVLAHLTTCTALNQLPIAPPSSAPPPPPPSSPPPIPPPSSPPLSCIPLSSSMDYSDTEGDMDLSD